MVYRTSADDLASRLGPRRATARCVRAPRAQLVLAILQLPIVIAAIVAGILQKWELLAILVGAYAVVTLARMLVLRSRAELHVHDHGIATADRSWRWDELRGTSPWYIWTLAGERIHTGTDKEGEAAIDQLNRRWIEHRLARARGELATDGAARFVDVRVRADGIERDGRVWAWDQLDIKNNDGFVMVFFKPGTSNITLFDSNVPDGPVFRTLVSELRAAR